jgi:hypothetical protein
MILKVMKNCFCSVIGMAIATALSGATFAADADHGGHRVAGEDKTAKSRVLGAGSEMLQSEGPIRAIHAHLCGFHFYNGDPRRAVRADHYCTHLNEEVFQCVIYDSDKRDARLIGVEYVISERLFKGLPAEEKKLWHSHRHEVLSGQLLAPDLPDVAEKALMKELVTTYGKTWHFWQVDRGDALPLGLPKLMMGFTADGQLDERMVETRDADLKIDSKKVREKRADIPSRPIAAGADAWQQGDIFQIDDKLLKTTAPLTH